MIEVSNDEAANPLKSASQTPEDKIKFDARKTVEF